MPQEIEIKLRVNDPAALKRSLKHLGASLVGGGTGRVHEGNVLFDTPQGDLARRGQLLRIRIETPEAKSKSGKAARPKRVLLTFKRPIGAEGAPPSGSQENHRHKVREELELEVSDAAVLTKIFEGLGMRGWFRYEKRRTTFHLPKSSWAKGLLIELDETPIGTFVELEGPPSAIDRAAKVLGFSRQEYILQNYVALYVEDCRKRGTEPKDMVFTTRK